MKFLDLLIAATIMLAPLAVQAQGNVPAAAVYASEPFSSGSFFATNKCSTQPFNCQNIPSRDDLISRADTCVGDLYGLTGTMASIGSVKDGYAGCILPSNYKEDPASPLKKKWAVCCVSPTKTGNMCTFDCTLFYNSK